MSAVMSLPAASPATQETVHVVVTCTYRKTVPAPPHLQLGRLPVRADSYQAAWAWIERLTGSDSVPAVTAENLYAGQHWAAARQLPGLARACDARLWVCSAGYGLISARALIRPYDAAFSGQQDRVAGGPDGARRWWQALSEWDGPEPGQPRSIRDLTAADSPASIMLALSASYLSACRDDIAEAARELPDADRLLIISAGARNAGMLDRFMVPADARAQAALGGTRQALNARIAARLLASGCTTRHEASSYMTDLLIRQPPVRRYEREKLSDQEVIAMILNRLANEPGLSASRMLRDFRDAGYACEQQRFAGLHKLATGGGR